ncbi:hypothetical protein [Bacillus cereus group sp. BfR-BA-01524]|uniref:WD40 repeat domain-containing protein n=1 Tax=Bacillus cereus group sp. BfR-BA-01524 TaxID=2920372 RepID=UPI001F590C7B
MIKTTNNKLTKRMTVIEVETGDIYTQFDELEEGRLIEDIAITDNGFSIVASIWGIRYYDNTGKMIREIFKWGEKSVAINPVDNKTLAIGLENGTIELWDLENGNLLRVIKDEFPDWVRTLEFSGDGTRLLSGIGHKIKIWNPTNGTRIGPEHSYSLFIKPQISFSGTKILYLSDNSPSEQNLISVVDVETGQPIIPQFKNSLYVMALSFEPNEKEIIVGGTDNAFLGCKPVSNTQAEYLRYSLDTGQQVGRTFEGHIPSGFHLHLSTANTANDLCICIDNESNVVLTWNRTTSRIERYINLDFKTKAKYTRISPNGKFYLLADEFFTPGLNHIPSNEQEKLFPWNKCIGARFNSSNLADVTNNIIASTNYPAPVCAGISKYNILDGVGIGVLGKDRLRYPVPNQSTLFFAVSPSHNNPTTISFDNKNRIILINMPIFLDINHLEEDVQAHRVSRSRFNITIKAKPKMVIQGDSAQSFQLDFDGSKLDTDNIDTYIIDPRTVLGTLGSYEALIQLVEKTAESMIEASAPGISMYLLHLIEHAQIPQTWNNAREYELIFREFHYENVSVQIGNETENVEYIFLLCSAVSHNFPTPCICKEETKTISPFIEMRPNDSRRWISLAFSNDALNTLAMPHRNSGDRIHREAGGDLRRSVNSYHKSEIGTLHINNNNIIAAKVSVSGGGSLSVRHIDPIFKNTLASSTVGYDLSASDVTIKWDISFISNFNDENITSVVLKPTVFLSANNIHYKFSSSLPGSLNTAITWFQEVFLKTLATLISSLIMKLGHIELMYDVFKNDKDSFNIVDAWGISYKDSSIVVIAEATTCRLGSL